MKLSNADELRISILLALAIGEVVGFLHFYGKPNFTEFVIVSLAGILLTIPVLWIESIQRRGVSVFSVLASIWFCAAMTAFWKEANLFERLLIAGLPLLTATGFLRKLLRPVDIDQQEAFLKIVRTEDKRLGRIARNTVGLFTCIILMAFVGPHGAPELWVIPLAIPITWFAWRIIFHLFIGQQSGVDANDPIEALTEQGAEARER